MEFIDVGKLIKNCNPVNGCTVGCIYCYAKKINDRFHITPTWSEPQFIEDRLKRITTKKPNNYLLTSMSDFSDWDEEWIKKTFVAIGNNPQHCYLFLTKCPDKIFCTISSPEVWMGVTVTTKSDKQRIVQMTNQIKAVHYFITFEPLFEDVGVLNLDKIEWIVIGTETGNRKGKIKAEKQWIENIVKQAKKSNIPVFMKKTLVEIVKEEHMLQQLPTDFRSTLLEQKTKGVDGTLVLK